MKQAIPSAAAMIAAFSVTSAAYAEDSAAPTLKDAFAECFAMGAALNRFIVGGDAPETLSLAQAHFNATTATNAMKWGRIHPEPGRYDFDNADKLVAMAEEHGMSITGHTLLWHQQTPDWVFEDDDGAPISRDALLARLKDHVETVMTRYKGKVRGWDVVNEAIEDDGSWRKTKWLEIIGPDYIEQVFNFAHQADPDAELYYNDYNMYLPGKRDAAVKLVKDLQAKGVAIHGVGMQGHYGVGRPTIEQFETSLDAYIATGLKVHVTELDMTVLPWPEDLPVGADISQATENRAELDPYTDGLPKKIAKDQAKHYAALFRAMAEREGHIDRVTFWGVTDRDNWKNNFPIRGRTDHPMLFDRDGQPKPAFYAVMKEAKACEK